MFRLFGLWISGVLYTSVARNFRVRPGVGPRPTPAAKAERGAWAMAWQSLLRIPEPIPPSVTSRTAAAALVVLDRLAGASRDQIAALTGSGSAGAYRALSSLARDGLVLAPPRGRGEALWRLTKAGRTWVSRLLPDGYVWPDPPGRGRGENLQHRRMVGDVLVELARRYPAWPWVFAFRLHGRGALSTYGVVYDPDARVDLPRGQLLIEVDRGTMRRRGLEAKFYRLREVLDYGGYGLQAPRRLLFVLHTPSAGRIRLIQELATTYLEPYLIAPPAGQQDVLALDVWVGTLGEVIDRFSQEAAYWLDQPGPDGRVSPTARVPHMGVAELVLDALTAAGVRGLHLAMGRAPVFAWRQPGILRDDKQVLLVLDGRRSAAVGAWARYLERACAEWEGRTNRPARGLILLSRPEDAWQVTTPRVFWTTPDALHPQGGVRSADGRLHPLRAVFL